jgi:hypothetical protein
MTNSANQVESVCACCGSPVPQIPGAHRRRRYCDNNGQCKQDAYRKRRKQLSFDRLKNLFAKKNATLPSGFSG